MIEPSSIQEAMLAFVPMGVGQSQSASKIILPIVGMAIALVVLGVVLLALRRSLLSPEDEIAGEGLSLHSIRELHRAGKISDEEFEVMKKTILPASREIHHEVLAMKGTARGDSGESTSKSDAAENAGNGATGPQGPDNAPNDG